MTYDHSRDSSEWDATELLQIQVDPTDMKFRCVAHAKSKKRRCQNHLAKRNCEAAMRLLASLPTLSGDLELLHDNLSELAELALCRNRNCGHQSQAEEIVQKWYAVILAEFQRWTSFGSAASSSTPSGASHPTTEQDDIERERRREEEEKARQKAEEQRRKEANRQAQRQREEQEAEDRRKAERDQVRQREHQARLRRERERLERIEQEKQEWAAGWTKYEEDWAKISRLNDARNSRPNTALPCLFVNPIANTNESVPSLLTTDWHKIIRAIWPEYLGPYLASRGNANASETSMHDIIPWPVKCGTWQEVNERNVEDFFRHASCEENPTAFIKLLRSQAKRWHPDRIYRLPGLEMSDEIIGRMTLVTQVINDLIRRTRESVSPERM